MAMNQFNWREQLQNMGNPMAGSQPMTAKRAIGGAGISSAPVPNPQMASGPGINTAAQNMFQPQGMGGNFNVAMNAPQNDMQQMMNGGMINQAPITQQAQQQFMPQPPQGAMLNRMNPEATMLMAMMGNQMMNQAKGKNPQAGALLKKYGMI